MGVRAADDLQGEPAQAQETSSQGVDHVDGLDPYQAGYAQAAHEDAGAVVDGVGVHGVAAGPPHGDLETGPGQQDDPGYYDGPGQHPAVQEVEAVLAGGVVDVPDLVEVVHGTHGDNGHERVPGLQQEAHGVDPVPGQVPRQADLPCEPAGPPGLSVCWHDGVGGCWVVHSPAIRCSPRSARIRRRCSASAAGSPLMVASVDTEAVWRRTLAIP